LAFFQTALGKGGSPVGEQLGLKPIMSLHSHLIVKAHSNIGDKEGYSGTWVCEKPTKLGVVALGYGYHSLYTGMRGNPMSADCGVDCVVGNADIKECHKMWPTLQHDFFP